ELGLPPEFKGVKRVKRGDYNKYKKQEQPMIDAINNLGTKLEKVIEHEHEHSMSLVPLTYVPPTYVKPTSTSEPTFTSTSEHTSRKLITQYDVTNIGPIISKYLVESKGKDK
ncbi:hypothetical protein L9F63_023030, partial [Diploptera punctata]